VDDQSTQLKSMDDLVVNRANSSVFSRNQSLDSAFLLSPTLVALQERKLTLVDRPTAARADDLDSIQRIMASFDESDCNQDRCTAGSDPSEPKRHEPAQACHAMDATSCGVISLVPILAN